jgi:isocitrate lyase
MLPEQVGTSIYHKVQEWFDSSSIHYKINSSHNSYLTFERLAKKSNIDILDKSVIEIGSGWLPLMPYFFKYVGNVSAVETYDLNKHYNKKNISSLNLEFSEKFEIPVERVQNGKYNLPEGIRYYPKTDLTKVPIKNAELVFSRFVLEHVSPLDIKRMHQKFKKEIPDAYIIHLISPSDHRAYVDKNLSNQDFLRYSASDWVKKQTRFDYHNRLRLPQYLDVFKELGYEILLLEFECAPIDSETYKKFKKVHLHVDYQKYSDDELTAGSINIVLKLG